MANQPTEGDEHQRLRTLLDAYMARKRLKSTDQRRLIVDAFFGAKRHVTVDDMHAIVRTHETRIGYATVYRTMKLLTECGVAEERRFGDGFTRYELCAGAHHDHLICVQCGDIAEFNEPRIEALQEEVAVHHGFELRRHEHELYGLCPDCQRRP
jgi:Fur family ferric uptake transcriptional regulator